MNRKYPDVNTRFLLPEERLICSDETEMPLVLEAQTQTDLPFLHNLLSNHSDEIKDDIARYGAILLRGFNVTSEMDFENTILSVKGFHGIHEAFMSEEGRVPVGDLKYVLHTNSVYKTGGTLYLGGFHSENYYSPDVPAYIHFYCLQSSIQGGETGLINMEKIYQSLNDDLKHKLEKKPFFVSKWPFSEVSERYGLEESRLEALCSHFDLPVIGNDEQKYILMYKPSVFNHPVTSKKSMQINLFEIEGLNEEIRKCFMNDYQGKAWFWHRVFWKSPKLAIKILETVYMMVASFTHSPRDAMKILSNKWKLRQDRKHLPPFQNNRAGSCFTQKEIQFLAQQIRNNYCSCLWKKGDILLIDNRKVMHAGMPGAGKRVIRAMISNPMSMPYYNSDSGLTDCSERGSDSIGSHFSSTELVEN